MRLHSLSIQGFGPFKDRQEIDFDALSQDRIFMLEGPTGAGKSSIIDAIVYALYDSTAHEAATKSGAAGQRIRSDYCEAGDETKVVLDFETGGARYRITRTAAYEAPKKSGEGTTKVNAKAILEFIKPPHEAIHQVREVNPRLTNILGMNHEQFSQMVVLPQGDFAAFLHATIDKRREVLASIFNTFFYDKLKTEVESKAKEIISKLGVENENIAHHVRNLSDEWKSDREPIDFENLTKFFKDGNESRADKDAKLEEIVSQLRPNSTHLKSEQTKLEKLQQPLVKELTQLQDSQKRIGEKENLEKELARLIEQKFQMAEKEELLKTRQKIGALEVILEARNSAEQKKDEALEEIDEDYVSLTAADVKARITKLNSEIPQLQKRSDSAAQAESDLEELEEEIEESEGYEEEIKALPGLTSKVGATNKKIETAKKRISAYRSLEKESMILHAAKQLKKGKACPVCGSLEHPNPVKGKYTFDQSELEGLEQNLSDLQQQLSEYQFELKSAESAKKKRFKPSTELKKKRTALLKQAATADKLLTECESAKTERDLLTDSQPFFIEYENAEKDFNKQSEKLQAEMKKLKISDESELEDLLEIDEDQLKLEIQTYSSRLAEVKALLAQQDFKKLPVLGELDAKIESLSNQLGDINNQLESVNNQLAVVERIDTSLNDAKEGIEAALTSISDIRASGDSYLRLQDWVDGRNSLGLSLTNFVLQERLEMILEYASRHLRRMSNGKYEFRLFEDRQGRFKQAGLGITIMDYFAGKERPAETLSGGETFYASLALALGLVEVVKADNGGIELGTLFIDEGFGSLSDDTLEEVLDVLEELREERVIGIISHVEGMKTQIPMRLEVRPTDQGPSTIKMSVGKIA